MVWDLGKAMQKKEEFESARLMDFSFRQRVRATRLFARRLSLDEASLVEAIASLNAEDLLAQVAKQTAQAQSELSDLFNQCLAEARTQLVAERGDPTPYRLG